MKCIACNRSIANGSRFCNRCGAAQPPSRTVLQEAAAPRKSKLANGNGTVYRRGKTWTACVTRYASTSPTPKRISKTKGGFRTKTEARLACIELAKELEHCASGAPQTQQVYTLEHYFRVVEAEHIPSLCPEKQQAYRNAWSRLAPLSDVPIRSITAENLRAIAESSCSSRGQLVALKVLLSKIFFYASADGLASKDLPSFIKIPPPAKPDRDAFSREECANILNLWSAGDEIAGYILILIGTGMMPGELHKLTKDMIDFSNACIRGAGLKTAQRRTQSVLLPAFVLPILQHFVDTVPGDKVLPYSNDQFYRRYYATLEKANCRPLCPYCCRHTTQTILALDASISPSQAARFLRHSIQMANIYTHVSASEAQPGGSSLSSFFAPAPSSRSSTP